MEIGCSRAWDGFGKLEQRRDLAAKKKIIESRERKNFLSGVIFIFLNRFKAKLKKMCEK